MPPGLSVIGNPRVIGSNRVIGKILCVISVKGYVHTSYRFELFYDLLRIILGTCYCLSILLRYWYY